MTENHPKFWPNHIILTYSHPASKVNCILNSKQFLKIRQYSWLNRCRWRFWRQLFWWQLWGLDDRFEILVTNFLFQKVNYTSKRVADINYKLFCYRCFKTVTIIKSSTLGCEQQLDMVSSMLVADVGDQMCLWQFWDVDDNFESGQKGESRRPLRR